MKTILRATFAACALAAGASAALAQQPYPSGPVTLVVPFAAGSGTDSVARAVASGLAARLKQPVVVDNKPGANAQVAAQFVAKAKPDGTTLFMTTNTSHSANPALYKSLKYDPIKDFTPVARVGELPFALAVHPAVPPRLASLPLAADYLVCCLPEGHALAHAPSVALRALAQESFVMFARDVAPANHDNVIALFHRAGIHLHTRHAARQWLTVVSLVALGMGVALVPASLAQAGVQGVRFVPITGLRHPTVGVLAWHEEADAPALQAFLEVARGGGGPP